MDVPGISKRHKQLGAANAVDMVLTVPLFVAAMLIVIQFALLCHAVLVVQYAAYSAARTARVSIWDSDLAFRDLNCADDRLCEVARLVSLSTTAARFAGDLTNLDGLAENIGQGTIGGRDPVVTAAAMTRLIAISPASSKHRIGTPSENQAVWNQTAIEQYVSSLTNSFDGDGDDDIRINRNQMILNKARYAFDDRNTQVTWEIFSVDSVTESFGGAFEGDLLDTARTIAGAGEEMNDWLSVIPYFNNNKLRLPSLPIEVTVRYRFALQVPIGARLFNNDPDRANPYARIITYTVRLT